MSRKTQTKPNAGKALTEDRAPRIISIAEARRIAFEASEKAQQAQIVYAEEEAKRYYDYKVDE